MTYMNSASRDWFSSHECSSAYRRGNILVLELQMIGQGCLKACEAEFVYKLLCCSFSQWTPETKTCKDMNVEFVFTDTAI